MMGNHPEGLNVNWLFLKLMPLPYQNFRLVPNGEIVGDYVEK